MHCLRVNGVSGRYHKIHPLSLLTAGTHLLEMHETVFDRGSTPPPSGNSSALHLVVAVMGLGVMIMMAHTFNNNCYHLRQHFLLGSFTLIECDRPMKSLLSS